MFRFGARRRERLRINNWCLGENGFCHDGSHATGSKDAHNRGDDVDKEDNQITHARF